MFGDIHELVGLSKKEAEKKARDMGLTFRIIKEDGESFILTMDYKLDRVNVVIENDIVVSAQAG